MSDPVLILAERCNPASRPGNFARPTAASDEVALTFTLPVGAIKSDFGRSESDNFFVDSLRVFAVALTDCVRECAAAPIGRVDCEGTPGLRSDCVLPSPLVRGSGSLLTDTGGRIDCELTFESDSARCDDAFPAWYIDRGRSRVRMTFSELVSAVAFIVCTFSLDSTVGTKDSFCSIS